MTGSRDRLKIALLFAEGGFVGREYYRVLRAANRRPDLVATVGRMSATSIAFEVERTGGKWNPPPIPADQAVRHFDDPSDDALLDLIRDSAIDIVVQGGIGILKREALAAPRIGFVNVHPGHLPEYRGNSCPEWALYNGDPVHATAHLIDEGVDTGPVICSRHYEVRAAWRYEDFRANLYAHCARVLLDAIERIEDAGRSHAWDATTAQTTVGAQYHPRIPTDKMDSVRNLIDTQGRSANRVELC